MVAKELPDSKKCGNQIDLIVAIRCKRMPAEACLYIPYISHSPCQVQRVASCGAQLWGRFGLGLGLCMQGVTADDVS